MLKISDFSKLTRVSVRMLRYYDSQGLLKPSKTDPENGYRMYGAEQVPELQKIILLRDLGFSVAQIRDLLQHWDDAYLTDQFKLKITEIESQIAASKQQITRLQSAIGIQIPLICLNE
ncbi:MAG: MerR family transcriptional regulator [Clostridia bacterium]|nr:MerR family transcriptional regulator [Clostridia bacterium]